MSNHEERNVNRRERVLIVRLSALGDVAMTLPVVYSVCRRYPGTDFYMLTRPFFARIFINRPENLHILEFDPKNADKGLRGFMRLQRRLRRLRLTGMVDLHNVLRTWLIDICALLRGCKVVMVDKVRSQRRGANRRKEQQTPYIERYAQTFARMGFPVTPDFTDIYAGAAPTPPVPIKHPAVGIAPFARYATKTYPAEMMEQVVRALSNAGVNVYLFGGGAEKATLDAWAKDTPNVTSLAGAMSISDEMAAMHSLDLMVSMDSANQHLAALAGTRVLTVWGSTAPICGFRPYGQTDTDAIIAGLPCQPCNTAGASRCPLGHMHCLTGLSPNLITERIIACLK